MAGLLYGSARGLPDSPWGPAGAVLTVLVMAVLAAGLGLLVTAASIAVAPWLRAGAPLVGMTFGYLFLAAGLMVVCWLRRATTLGNSLLLRSARWRLWQYAAFALITVAALVALQQLLFYLTAQFGAAPADPMQDLDRLRQLFRFDQPATLILLAVLAVIAAPLAEEFVFRGLLFAAFAKTRLGVVGSAVILSALWAALHWGYSSQSLVALLGIGLLFAYIVWRTGSLWPAIVGHAANNLVAVVALMGLQV